MVNVKSSLGIIGVGAGSAILGGVLGYVAGKSASKRKKSSSIKRRKSKNSSYARRTKRRKTGRKTPRTAGKRKDTSRKRIRYTKNGQPYVIMASGKARFIKKRGAKASHKKRGGRY